MAGENAFWTSDDELALVNFLLEHQAEGGDGANFKKSTFQAAAAMLEPLRTKGAPKGCESCKNKWQKLRKTYHTVHALMEQSGFTWSAERGADINSASEGAWQAYVQKHKEAERFRNKGWSLYDAMHTLMPSTAKGAHVYHPGSSTTVVATSSGSHGDGDGDSHVSLSRPSTPRTPSPQPQSTTPPRWSPSPHPSTPPHPLTPPHLSTVPPLTSSSVAPSASSKRKPELSAVIPSSAHKKPRTTSSQPRPNSSSSALHSLSDRLVDFTSVFRSGVQQMAAPPPGLTSSLPPGDASPVRKRAAMKRLQEIDGDLSVDDKVTMLNIFEGSAGAADAYMMIEDEDLRKAWVQRKVEKALLNS
ncbi:hypothetical protein B0H21DRAFT_891281 [Amylocystis lapponica]|nr:hypothetical protein B0H21DRAFT_891281 [Amylocystis lapponica]